MIPDVVIIIFSFPTTVVTSFHIYCIDVQAVITEPITHRIRSYYFSYSFTHNGTPFQFSILPVVCFSRTIRSIEYVFSYVHLIKSFSYLIRLLALLRGSMNANQITLRIRLQFLPFVHMSLLHIQVSLLAYQCLAQVPSHL